MGSTLSSLIHQVTWPKVCFCTMLLMGALLAVYAAQVEQLSTVQIFTCIKSFLSVCVSLVGYRCWHPLGFGISDWLVASQSYNRMVSHSLCSLLTYCYPCQSRFGSNEPSPYRLQVSHFRQAQLDTSSSIVWPSVVGVLLCHGICVISCLETRGP